MLRPSQMMFGMLLQNEINEGLQAQAATPIGEISKLMDQFVNPIRYVLLLITAITCLVAVGILVSIYNSMNDRRRDIAVMRALGAAKHRHVGNLVGKRDDRSAGRDSRLGGGARRHRSGERHDRGPHGRAGQLFSTTTAELYILPFILALAAIAGFVPALVAYRTDVSRSLSA
ncbi:MAG: ABC transporter permease [Pirellulaceae bacterium]